MDKDLKQQVEDLQKEVAELKDLFFKGNYSTLQVFSKVVQFDAGTIQNSDITLKGGKNIIFDRTTGSSIGTDHMEKISVYGVTPIIQQNAITAPTGGTTVDTQARTAIGTIINVLKNFGITA